MIRAATAFILVALMAAPAAGQGRGRKSGKIPPGHMPAAGECRVWRDGVPPGHQPPPMSCAEAERMAAREGGRVIYGSDTRSRDRDYGIGDRDDERRRGEIRRDRDRARDDRRREEIRRDRDRDDDDDDDDGRDRGRAIPRTDRYPTTGRYPDGRAPDRRRADISGTAAFQKGYDDGRVKGREDARDRDSFDPNRHSWYRSANRGYNRAYGSRTEYAEAYRAGFRDGYERAYRDNADARTSNRPGWWPF